MLTIKAEVLKDKKRRDGTYNVKIRFIKEKRVKRISTNLFAIVSDSRQGIFSLFFLVVSIPNLNCF